ncbi:MAG: hypothetical protein CL596_02245 [Alteromonas sp.]|nr:hypothetical protein [Alteromonas sp.]MAY22082.1 hypothetical protein [Flavobacteriaceae bacterium]
MEFTDFLIFALPVNIVEILAFILGIRYLKLLNNIRWSDKLLVVFLGFVVFIEIASLYPIIAYFSKYEYFSFVQDTRFEGNRWLANFYDLVNPIAISLYFLFYIKNETFKRFFYYLLGVFLLTSLYFQYFYTSFFETSPTVVLLGTFVILGVLLQFFYELLKTDLILNLNKYLPMYIAVGCFVFNLVTAPLSIFGDYFNISKGNDLFVMLQVYTLLISNIFMYSCFSLGFIRCSKKKPYN